MKTHDKFFASKITEPWRNGLEMVNSGRSSDLAVYWSTDKTLGTLSLTEAQELIEVLQAIIADYPKEPTNEEKSRWFEGVQGFQPGELVRAEKGDRAIENKIVDYGGNNGLYLDDVKLDKYEEDGYTLIKINGPKEPTNEEILNELPNGSIIQFDDEKSRWFKTDQGWYNSRDGVRCTDTSVFNSDYDGDMSITVKYRGDE